MDTTNFSETPKDKLICTNAASNTDPVVCAFCGFKDYVPAFSQPNCFRPFCSATPRCKQLPENCEDGFSAHEPVFSSPPLLQPLFHNRLVPPNVFYSNLNMADSNSNQFIERQPNITMQKDKFSGLPHVYMHYEGDGAPIQQNDQVNRNCSGNIEAENATKMQMNLFSFVPMCACSNFVPWTCNPYITPMISYYVSWNSMGASENFPPSNCSATDDKDIENTKETLATQKELDSNGQKSGKNYDEIDLKDVDSKEVNKYENDENLTQGKSERIESKISNEFNTSSTSFVSISSLEFAEDIITIIDRKKNDNKVQSRNVFSSKHFAESCAEKKIQDPVEEIKNRIDGSENMIKSPLEDDKNNNDLEISPDSLQISKNDAAEELISDFQSVEENAITDFQFSNSQLQNDTSLKSSKNSSFEKLKEEFQVGDQVKPEKDEDGEPDISTTGAALVDDLIEKKLENCGDTEVDQSRNPEPDVINSQDEGHQFAQDIELVATETNKKNLLREKEEKEEKVKAESNLKVLPKIKSGTCKLPVNIRSKNSSTIVKQSRENSWNNVQHSIRRQHYCSTPENKAENSDGVSKAKKPKFRSAVPSRATENLKLKSDLINLKGSDKKPETERLLKLRPNAAVERENKFSCKSRK